MGKQPGERSRRRRGANRPATNTNPNGHQPGVIPPATRRSGTERNPSRRFGRLQPYLPADIEQRRVDDLKRLTRSPLVPRQFSFMSSDLVLRAIALGMLLFSYVGTLALARNELSWLQAIFYSICIAIFASTFIYSTTERGESYSRLIAPTAILIELVAAVSAVLILGFSVSFYFVLLPFYIVVGHIQASFETRPAVGATLLVWLCFLGVLALDPDPTTQSVLTGLILLLSIPFFMVTLVVRFIVREGRQRMRLVEALEELTVSEERYRQVTDRANDAIYTASAAGRFTFVNPKMNELTGYEEAELLGRHFAEILTPENRQIITAAFGDPARRPPAEKKAPPDKSFLSLEIVRRDGAKVLAEVTAAPIYNAQGKHSGWVGIARDVTERTRMRVQVERRNRDLSALNVVISTASKSLELDKLLNDVVTTLVEVLKADVAGITLIEEETRLLKVGAYKGLSDTVVRAVTNASIEESEGLTREVARSGQPLLIDDLTSDPRAAAAAGNTIQEMGLRSFVAVPLKSRDRLVGIVSLISHQKAAFQQDDLDLLVSIGYSLAVSIENARLYGTSRSQVREMTCLAEIARAINLSETLGQTLSNIAESISTRLGYKGCVVCLVESEQLYIQSYGSYGLPNGFIDKLNQLSQDSTISRQELLQLPIFRTLDAEGPVVYQISSTPGPLESVTQLAISEGWRSVMTVPFHIQGQPVGVISCYTGDINPPPESELRLLITIANQTSLAVQNAELFREQQRRADQLRAVSEIGRQIGSILSVDELLPYITQLLQQTFDYFMVGIFLIDSDKPGELVLRAAHGWNTKLAKVGARINTSDQHGLISLVGRTGEPIVVPDVSKEPRYRDYEQAGTVHSELVVPIKRGPQVIGVIDLASIITNEFDEIDLATMQALAEQVSIALENARLYTEVNRVVVQLTNANVELEEATRHKSEFLANMSHELRTPLNAIIGFSEVLQDQVFGELNEKQIRYVNNILTSGRHLLTLVNDVLDLAKVEAGRMELHPEDFMPDDAVNDVQAILSVSASKKSLLIQNQFKAEMRFVRADKSKFKQIMYNLLSNAVKFTPEKGRIIVGNYRHSEGGREYLATWVKDTGIGIRKEDQQRIFEEFRQVDSSYSRQHQGTGLGLALSKRLVELHGGRIWVESEPGLGSLFIFVLPMHTVQTQPLNLNPAPADAFDRLLEAQVQKRLEKQLTDSLISYGPGLALSEWPNPAPNGPTVLVVEDDDRAAEILSIYLSEAGYRVERAASGPEALQKAHLLQPPPALITLDVLLPGPNGWEVLRDFKASEATAAIPVIIITFASEGEGIPAEQAPDVFGFIAKPVIKERLLQMAAQALNVAPLNK